LTKIKDNRISLNQPLTADMINASRTRVNAENVTKKIGNVTKKTYLDLP
jgi:hypothetical protein